MNQTYQNSKDSSFFSLTKLDCLESKKIFQSDDLYKILWLQKGKINLTIDGIKYQLKENQILFLTPLHQLELNEFNADLIALLFNREFYCIQQHDKEVSCYGYLFFGSSEVPLVNLTPEEQKSFGLLLQVMLEEFENTDHIQGEMLQVLLKRFLIKSTRLARKTLVNPQINQDKLDLIRQYNVLVEMHFREKHKVAEYAEILNKSPKTISNLFGEYNSKSPLQVIQDRISLEAKRLFIHTDKTAKEVAFELGFEDAAHFSRFFKKLVGKSPSEFKKSSILTC
jgi:AraC-like DNA-binding protein